MERTWPGGRGGPPLLLAIALLISAAPGAGHIEYGARTLQMLVADADVVAHARVLALDGPEAIPVSGLGRPTLRAELLEVLKGDAPPGEIRFAQHGHGVAIYEPGEEVLLFLRRIERSRELDELAPAGVAWVSLQEHDEKYAVTPGAGALLLASVRAYAEVETIGDAAARLEALRQLTLLLLTSGDARLATSAVQGLVLAEGVPLLRAEDVATLEPALADPALPIGLRLALRVELERRGLLADPERWVGLLAETRGAERAAVIRAAGQRASAPVDQALLALLAGDDDDAAREAAVALGRPGNRVAVGPLDAALSGGDARLRMAAIRGLGRIGTPEARRVLERTARFHPDPDTRRRAGAEVATRARAAGERPEG
jgi:hypothetical protein